MLLFSFNFPWIHFHTVHMLCATKITKTNFPLNQTLTFRIQFMYKLRTESYYCTSFCSHSNRYNIQKRRKMVCYNVSTFNIKKLDRKYEMHKDKPTRKYTVVTYTNKFCNSLPVFFTSLTERLNYSGCMVLQYLKTSVYCLTWGDITLKIPTNIFGYKRCKHSQWTVLFAISKREDWEDSNNKLHLH